jgi:hypothetical protein
VSRIEDFDSELWDDPAIEALSLEATILYIWTWTNSRVGAAGIYKATRRALTESKVPDDRLDAALAELQEADLAFYDETYVWVKARVKRLRTRTVAMCRGIAKAIAKVPEGHPYRVAFMERYGSQVWSSGTGATTIADEIRSLSGETGVSGGSDPVKPFPLGERGSHPRKSSTYKGKGNGKGHGKGPLGRGVGREPDARQRWLDFAAEHFPDHNPDLVLVVRRNLERAGTEATVEAIRAELENPQRDAA